MAEGSPTLVKNLDTPNVVVEFEKHDFSVGTARYRNAVPVTKNLSMKPNGGGLASSPMVHANVEVRLRDEHGKAVPMTRRMVRTWDVQPAPHATVENLRMWHIVGLQQSEFSPFAPFPVSPNERPGDANFKWDRPGRFDAPGLQLIKPTPFGILQEFLVGNSTVGGAYYQTYTLFDGDKYRIINSRSVTLSAVEYNALLTLIDSGAYTKSNLRFLYFMPTAGTDDIGDMRAKSGGR